MTNVDELFKVSYKSVYLTKAYLTRKETICHRER